MYNFFTLYSYLLSYYWPPDLLPNRDAIIILSRFVPKPLYRLLTAYMSYCYGIYMHKLDTHYFFLFASTLLLSTLYSIIRRISQMFSLFIVLDFQWKDVFIVSSEEYPKCFYCSLCLISSEKMIIDTKLLIKASSIYYQTQRMVLIAADIWLFHNCLFIYHIFWIML